MGTCYVYQQVKHILYILLLLPAANAGAQAINNAVTYRNINHSNYVRHHYDNDFFTATDKYYTQGINMEVVTPGFSRLPSRFLLLHPKGYSTQYGMALQHNAYTPTSITDVNIRYGDRPYAAAAMLQAFTINTHEEKRQRISTMLSLGVTGQIAGGQWMQETIHRNLDNVMPEGWKYQVANDAVLNYRLFYEKSLLRINDVLEVNGTGLADIGTLQTKAGVGANVILGYFESAYSSQRKRRFAAYAYAHAQVYAIGYDATMQGGLFNRSIYSLPTKDIERLIADNRLGFVIRYGGIYLEYFQAQLTREFATGNPHAWGGVLIGVGF